MLDGVPGFVAPEDWLLSQACEEFGCLPSEILKEDPELIIGIMELRTYARVKAFIEREETDEEAISKAGLSEFWVQTVFDITADTMRFKHGNG